MVEAGGIGFRIHVPLSTHERLPREGSPVRLLLVHHLREDREALYGFATEEEREFFEVLNSVSGVGPALALALISALPFGSFRAAVVNGDAAALTRVRGVGKKLAGRLILDLAEPMKARGPLPSSAAAPAAGAAADAAAALAALGFDRREADAKASEAARALGPGAEPGEIVREVLRGARR